MDLDQGNTRDRVVPGRRLLFIHHSCGGQLLASPGPDRGTDCIYETHPNGGGLRKLLEGSDFEVHEASYNSRLGQQTDIFDWLPKFRQQMPELLRCDRQDTLYPDGRRNGTILFKSCYPNNLFLSEGVAPGDPSGPDLTVWNAKAAYRALLSEFQKYPDVLFVCVTAPPLCQRQRPQPAWKKVIKAVLGRASDRVAVSGPLARQFNNWLAAKGGWLDGYPGSNVAVFNYYDVLTKQGKSDFCEYPTGGGYDSHPSREGNQLAAAALVPFMNALVRVPHALQS